MLNKMKYAIMAFMIPAIVWSLLFIALGIFLGEYTVLLSDLKGQYVSIFQYWINMIHGDVSPLYSFTKGIGGGMISTFSYYGASPLNFILLFFTNKLYLGIAILIILKLSLSSLTSYLFFKNVFPREKTMLLPFAFIYSLSGYAVAMHFNVMWLDAYYLLPLILLGLHHIFSGKSSALYAICLAILLISNYYMAYMVCLFVIIYFIYYVIKEKLFSIGWDNFLKLLIKIAIPTLLSIGVSVILIFPTFLEMANNTIRMGYQFEWVNFSIINESLYVLKQFFVGANDYSNITSLSMPIIYSSIFVFVLLYFYFVNPDVSKRNKILSGLVILVFLISILFTNINNIWHAFAEPNGFHHRFVFVFVFFFILIAVHSFFHKGKIKNIHYAIVFVFYLLLSVFFLITKVAYPSAISIILTMVILSFYLLLIYIYRSVVYENKTYSVSKGLISIMIIGFVIGELILNVYMINTEYRRFFKKEYDGYQEIIQPMMQKYQTPNTDFYRIDKDNAYTFNDGMLMNYYGGHSFLSTENEQTKNFFNNFGNRYAGGITFVGYGNTPLFDALLSFKYKLSKKTWYPYYEKVDTFSFSKFDEDFFGYVNMDLHIYQNPYALPLIFASSPDIKKFTELMIKKGILSNYGYQNMVFNTLLGTDDDLLKPYNVEKVDDNNYKIQITNSEPIFFKATYFLIMKPGETIDFYINDEKILDYRLYQDTILSIKNTYEGQTIDLRIESTNEEQLVYFPQLFWLDLNKFQTAISELKENGIYDVKQTKNEITGKIIVPNDKTTMFTSIPYEQGWTIKANGKVISYEKAIDSFIMFDLEPGEYNIEMKFIPPGLQLGAWISVISVLLLMVYLIFEKKIISFLINTYTKFKEIIHYLVAGFLTTVISIVSYALFLQVFEIHYVISNILSWICAVTFAYLFTRYFVFYSRINTFNGFLKEIIIFLKYRFVSLGLDVALMVLLITILSMNEMLSKVIVQVIIVAVNYIFSKFIIFKKESD